MKSLLLFFILVTSPLFAEFKPFGSPVSQHPADCNSLDTFTKDCFFLYANGDVIEQDVDGYTWIILYPTGEHPIKFQVTTVPPIIGKFQTILITNESGVDNGGKFQSVLQRVQADCSTNKWETDVIVDFSDKLGEGLPTEGFTGGFGNDFKIVTKTATPESPMGRVFSTVCKY